MASLKAHSGNQSDALWVNWDQGGGELSGYLLTLYEPNGSWQVEQRLGPKVTQFVFSHLVPGRLYRAEVLSLSGDLSNRASTLGRTGETQSVVRNNPGNPGRSTLSAPCWTERNTENILTYTKDVKCSVEFCVGVN